MRLDGIDSNHPLGGLSVVECGPLLPVPCTGAHLARLGASVLRIEPPGGDPARTLYGGWLYELYGTGKDHVELDLRTDVGRSGLSSHVATADVVITGQRPASARRFGLDADSVRELNPDVIHCAIIGFGNDLSDRPGHDLTFLARSGALAEPATPSAQGQPPRRPAIPVADLAAAAAAIESILAAVLGRSLGHGGRTIEIPIADVAVSWMAPRLGHAVAPGLGGALDPANDIYRCSDGDYLAISALEQGFWTATTAVLGLPSEANEWNAAQRIDRTESLGDDLAAAFALRPSGEVLESLMSAGVPVERVATGTDVVERVGTDPAAWRRVAVPDWTHRRSP